MAKTTLAALAALLLGSVALAQDIPTVAVASSLLAAAPELARVFEENTGARVRFAFGSSGNLTRQIQQGAPFEVFLSADPGYTSALVEQGLSAGNEVCFAFGRLALFVNKDSPLELGVSTGEPLADLGKVLTDPRLERLAIANPEHAPYGRAARETLESNGLWSALESRLVIGENVAQAAQFAATAAVQAGLISHSLAVSPGLADRGRYALVPLAAHQPVRHCMVLLPGTGETAHAFFAFVQGPTGRAILSAHGFSSPTN